MQKLTGRILVVIRPFRGARDLIVTIPGIMPKHAGEPTIASGWPAASPKRPQLPGAVFMEAWLGLRSNEAIGVRRCDRDPLRKEISREGLSDLSVVA